MVVASTFRSLKIYDILANLLPGLMLLIIIAATISVEEYFSGISTSLLVAGFFVVGFIIGHVIQGVASKLNGTPRLFGLVLSEMRNVEPYDPDGTFQALNPQIRDWFGFKRATTSDLNLTEVEEKFWSLARDEFELSDDFKNHGRLMQLVLSYLETVSAARALRFQSIHTFHRSMWGMWILSIPLIIAIQIGGHYNILATRSLSVFILVGSVSLLGIRVFGERKEKFNKKVVEYAIVDFYVQQKSQ
ncbi:hypothetical protein EGH24_12210 [Halonotius terrestris]|uniref:Uncharacterized protein n=1 Tax=Halonotius terrestris TaxID=2487750 RepID=A0A8J8TBX2_9EURY|nr:hypothetical protein [Halonotius terrestris]TQQ79150.1 hypothetical protein EGH24_12210 [Halonotius terrestris]